MNEPRELPRRDLPPHPGPPPGVPERRHGIRWGRWARRASIAFVIAAVSGALSVLSLVAWYFTQREAEREAQVTSGELELGTGTRAVVLYFATAAGDSLTEEPRQIVETDRVSDNVRILIEELARGPRSEQARGLIPTGTRLRHVFFDESGQVLIDFTPELRVRFNGGSSAEYLLLSSLVRTLSANLPTVNAVTVTVEGRPIESLGGHFPLDSALPVSEWR